MVMANVDEFDSLDQMMETDKARFVKKRGEISKSARIKTINSDTIHLLELFPGKDLYPLVVKMNHSGLFNRLMQN